MTPSLQAPLFVGLAGGSASGKNWLSARLARVLGPRRCAVILLDHCYCDHPKLSAAQRRILDFDSPAAFETKLLLRHLRDLHAGRSVPLPRCGFDLSRRTKETDLVAPVPIILIERLLGLTNARLRRAFDLTIFVHVPAALHLLRRIRRDTTANWHDSLH